MAHSNAGRLHATVTVWPDASGRAIGGAAVDSGEIDDVRPLPDFSRVGLLLCFASAVLTLIGVGSALERILS